MILAEWAAIAIENARANALLRGRQDELERAVASLEATSEIAQALAADTDLEHVLELIAKRARALTEARALVVLLEDGAELVVAARAGELDGTLVGDRIPIEGSVSGQVLRSGEPERLADAPSRCVSHVTSRLARRLAYSCRCVCAEECSVCSPVSTACATGRNSRRETNNY